MKLPSKTNLEKIYGEEKADITRFENLACKFKTYFNEDKMEYFSSPGRMEIIGNHTDHNGGKVLAASINMDTIGAATQNNTDYVTVISEGYEKEIRINLNQLDKVEKNQETQALVAGILKGVRQFGFKVSGFNAYISTNVIPAAGVSSSASFEMLLCAIINYLFNQNQLNYIDYAKIGQYAENHYWNKSSGLMDQMACAVGGTILLDFSKDIKYEKVAYSFEDMGYDLFIINTGKGHGNLSEEYSKIPFEMKEVANALNKLSLAECGLEEIVREFGKIQSLISNDRALLRALHYFKENKRVDKAMDSINKKDTKQLLKIMTESGNSSWKWLQNCYVSTNEKEQKVALTLALTEHFLDKTGDGCCRVHGGGFAGVIVSIIPKEESANYVNYISSFLDAGNIFPIQIREAGAVHLG